jgi:acetylornithine/N-succinyldiaminopimelate aminotransferase
MFRTNEEALAAFRAHEMANYDPAPVAFTRGEGARLWDVEGKTYLDFAAGVAVTSLGHGHPRWVRAVQEQAATLVHTSNLYVVEKQVQLARRLTALSGLRKAFFCNSGTEAVEAALKLARYWGHANGRTHVLATQRSFHGRTLGALTLTGQPQYRQGFEPLLQGVDHVPFGDVGALRAAVRPDTCAIVLEPVQGEGGVHVPPPDYLRAVRELCDERDLLLVLDEVQTGIGRTGRWFAHEVANIRPDIMALAKGLGGGFPIGAVLASERADTFRPGAHGSTFGGNPLACAAALATLNVIEEENLLAHVRRQGQHLATHLAHWEDEGVVRDARGVGLLQAFDLIQGSSKAQARSLLERGLLVSNIGDATIRLCPPLNVTAAEIEEALDVLGPALGARPPPVRQSA